MTSDFRVHRGKQCPDGNAFEIGSCNVQLHKSRLEFLGDRLRDADRLAARIKARDPEADIPAFMRRLRARRAEVVAALKDNGPEKPARSIAAFAGSGGTAESAMSLLDWLKLPPGTLRLLTCQQTSGLRQPYWTDSEVWVEVILSGSTAGFGPDFSLFDEGGAVIFSAYLDDDTDFLFPDHPEWVFYTVEVRWSLPKAPCDCLIEAGIDVSHRIEVSNGADWSKTSTHLSSTHTRANGQWNTKEISPGSQRITFEKNSGDDEGAVHVKLVFDADEGTTPRVAITHGLLIEGIDGRIGVTGQFLMRQATSMMDMRPLLWYNMVPKNPLFL